MRIEFSDHAKRQLKRRNISQSHVVKVVRKPEEVNLSFRGRKLHRAKVGDKLLEIVIVEEESKTVVITQYYLEE